LVATTGRSPDPTLRRRAVFLFLGRPIGRASPERDAKKSCAEVREAILAAPHIRNNFMGLMVGGTGIEPVTPPV
jgi:hypothetical protein